MRVRESSVGMRGPGARASARCLLPALALLLLALPLRADVFWRIPKRADSVLQQMGGTRVYSTAVQLNGAPGTLSAYAFANLSAHQTAADLARQLGLPAPAPFSASLLTHVEKGRLMRLFVLPAVSGSEACVVLAFDQSLGDFERGRQSPPAWPDGLPALGGTPVFTAVCALTRTTFVTAETTDAPDAAVQEAAQNLRAAGWSETLPSAGAFRLLTSARKQCILLASRNPETDKTTISLLQREGATP